MNWEAFNAKCRDWGTSEYVYRVPPDVIEFCKFPIVKLHANPFTCVIPEKFEFLECDVYGYGFTDRLNWLLLSTEYRYDLFVNCNVLSEEYGKLLIKSRTVNRIQIIYSNIEELVTDMMKWMHVTSFNSDVMYVVRLLNEERALEIEAKSFADVFQPIHDNHKRINWYRDRINEVIASNLQYHNFESRSFLCWVHGKHTRKDVKN